MPREEQLPPLDGDDLDALAALDECGWLIGRDEDFSAYCARIKTARAAYEELKQALEQTGTVELFPGMSARKADAIAPEVIAEGELVTRELYGFAVDFVPGFYLSKGVGPLWAGCSISDDDPPIAVILLRKNFQSKMRYWIYNRTELVAHELCHAARSALHDLPLEEFFAYRSGKNKFRRWIGNCFLHQRDAVLFLLPMLLLPVAGVAQLLYNALPMWPFWIAAGLYPAFLLIRNAHSMKQLNRARKRLEAAGFSRPLAVLFRSTFAETCSIAATRDGEELTQQLRKWTEKSLRWRVILHRFSTR